MAREKKAQSEKCLPFGERLALEQLAGLTAELQLLRQHPPLIKRKDGKYEGDILGFVKGLRLSARVIYFLRERLSSIINLEVNWGHILDDSGQSCSPECDVIIHSIGYVRHWNGSKNPVMDFKFVKASEVLAVVSCKSQLTSVDKDYVSSLKKYGVKKVFLFAECCKEPSLPQLRKKAHDAGYKGFWCLYTIQEPGEFVKEDEKMLKNFGDSIQRSLKR